MSKHMAWLMVAMGGAVTMAVLCWATATYGIGASTDTVTYLSVAQNVLKGNGFVSYDGGVMVEFPPVYPLLLCGALYLLPVPALSAVKLVSVLSAGGCHGAATYLLQRHLHYPATRWAGWLLLLLSVPLWSVYMMGWSEPPFIFFTLLWFIFLAPKHSRIALRGGYLLIMRVNSVYRGCLCSNGSSWDRAGSSA